MDIDTTIDKKEPQRVGAELNLSTELVEEIWHDFRQVDSRMGAGPEQADVCLALRTIMMPNVHVEIAPEL